MRVLSKFGPNQVTISILYYLALKRVRVKVLRDLKLYPCRPGIKLTKGFTLDNKIPQLSNAVFPKFAR